MQMRLVLFSKLRKVAARASFLREPPWGLALAYSSHLSRTFVGLGFRGFGVLVLSPFHLFTFSICHYF